MTGDLRPKKQFTQDFTTDRIGVSLIKFALPLIASNILQLLYSTIDMAVIGNFIGAEGVAAIATGGEVFNLTTFVCVGFCNGGQTLIAQYVGKKEGGQLSASIETLLTSCLCLGTLFCAAIVLSRNWLCTLLNVPGPSFGMAKQYLLICGFGQILTFGYNAVSVSLRGQGDSRHPLIFVSIATVANLIMDILFVGVFKWGVRGAALATVLAQAVSFFGSLFFLFSNKIAGFDAKTFAFHIDTEKLRIISKIGIPLAVQSAAVHVSMLYVNGAINDLGVAEAATFAIGVKIDDLCAKTTLAFQYAGGTVVAQNIAAGNEKRVEKTVYTIWGIVGMMHLVFAVFYMIFGKGIFGLFLNEPDSSVFELAPVFISAIIWTFIPLALNRGVHALLIGIGNGFLSMLCGIFGSSILRIGLSLLFGKILGGGFYGFVLGYGLAPAGIAIPGLIYFLSGMWKKFKIIKE